MLDLEDIFKIGYVDIAFGGSTSIKKVLPNLLPELNYDDLEVSSGTDAMVAFAKMLDTDDQKEVGQIRKEMLDYCRLDTLAMVRIFEKMRAFC